MDLKKWKLPNLQKVINYFEKIEIKFNLFADIGFLINYFLII